MRRHRPRARHRPQARRRALQRGADRQRRNLQGPRLARGQQKGQQAGRPIRRVRQVLTGRPPETQKPASAGFCVSGRAFKRRASAAPPGGRSGAPGSARARPATRRCRATAPAPRPVPGCRRRRVRT